jgi:hypothetical protein
MKTELISVEARELVAQLGRIGHELPDKLGSRILAHGVAALEPLLEMATDISAAESGPPRCYGPIHALRLLGELKDTGSIVHLLLAYPMDTEPDPEVSRGSIPDTWDRELPQIIGSYGAAAAPHLWEFADDSGNPIEQRSVAMISLAYSTVVAPELREEVVSGLHERMLAAEDPQTAAYILMALANLQVPEFYKEVMELYKTQRIDRELMSPGMTRQMLLQKNPKLLDCAKHTLEERYDQHPIMQR